MARSLYGMQSGINRFTEGVANWQNEYGTQYDEAQKMKASTNNDIIRNVPIVGKFAQSGIDSLLGTVQGIDDFMGDPLGISKPIEDYVTAKEIAMGPKTDWTLSDPASVWQYVTDGSLARDTGNLVGSMATLAVPGGAAGKAAATVAKAALPYIGRQAAGLAAKGIAANRMASLANGINTGTSYIPTLAAILAGSTASSIGESMAEGGNKLRESLNNGDDLDTAQDKGGSVFWKNLPFLLAANATELGTLKKGLNGLKGAYNGGKAARRAEQAGKALETPSKIGEFIKGAGAMGASAANEGIQEATQEGFQASVEPDKYYSYNPLYWSDDQWKAAKDTFAPMLFMGAGGGSARLAARKVGEWVSPEEIADDMDLHNADSAPSFNIPRTANYNISDEVSDRNLTQSTESKLRLLDQAYYDEYGEHLNVTSMRRHWGTNSKHESGSAFDVADAGLEGTPERRRFLEAKASEIGLKPLDEYENPSSGATGGHMHFSDDGTALNANTGFSGWSGNSDMDNLINSYAEQYGVDPALVAAVAEQESNFNQGAQSKAGAIGTMQLMPQTAEGLGVDPNDMAGNIEGGTKYLAQLLQQFGGDVHKALEAYNGGPGNVGIAQTMKYADEVMQKYEKFKSHKGGTFSWQGAPADISTTEDYNKLFEDNGFTKTDTARDFLENLRMLSEDVDQSKNRQLQQDSKKAEQALNSRDENTIQQTAESLGFGHQDNAPKRTQSPMPIQDIATHLQNNGWVEFGSKANADEFAKSDIAKGLERYSNTGFAAKGYNPYAPKRQSTNQTQSQNQQQPQEPAPAKPTQEQAQPQPSQSVSMLGEVVPPLPKEEQVIHHGTPLNSQEVGRLNSLMQNMPQNDQEKIQTMFSIKDYDGIRNMMSDYMADEKINRNDIESARRVAQILMSNPKAIKSATGGAQFSLNRLNDILKNGSLSDINRMNNALASRLKENGENPHRVLNLPARWEEPAIEGEVQEAERDVQPYNANQLEAPAINIEHLSSDEFLQTLNPTERGFMEYLDDVFDDIKLGFNDVMQYLHEKRDKIFDKRMEYVISKGIEGLSGAFYTDGGKMVLNEVPSQEVQSAWTNLLGMRRNFGASLANAPEEYKNEYLRLEKIVKDYLRPTITEQCKKNESYRRLSYAITGLEKIADKANEYEHRVSEEGRRSGTKSYRDVSAEEREALEGSATAWASVLQNDTRPKSKPKQNKPVDKSRRLNPPSGVVEDNSRAYGNEPVRQEENSADTIEKTTPAYGSDVAENVARMANGSNREAWIDNAAERNANESAGGKNVDNSNVEVKLTGNEFGEYKDLKELRSKAKAYYRENLQGTSVDNPILGKVNLSDNQIDFTGKGISKALSTSAKEHKLLLIRYLPQLIKNAKEVSANKNIKNKRNASQYTYLTSYAVIDGQKQPVEITIFTDVNGNRYYNHVLPLEESNKKRDLPVYSAQAPNNESGTPTVRQQVPSTSTVPQNQQNVKEKKSIIIGGEKYYIADTPSEPNPKSDKKEKAATQVKKETESRTADEKPANAKENPETIAVNGETFYYDRAKGIGLPLAMYGNKKSLFGKGAEKKKTIYRTNRQQYGNEVEVRTDDGKAIKVHYALIPADKLIASNKADDTLSKNEAYPQDLQPRDRQRTAMRLQVDSMANSLRPEDLADSRNLNQGAPIVRSDLTVLNGNGRTLAIQRAYQTGKAEEYKQYLLDNAEKLGLNKSQVANMVKGKGFLNTKKGKHERGKSSQPILVRVVDDLSEGDTQSVINSTTGGQRMGSTEQAKADSKKIKSDTLRKYAENNKGDLTTSANEEFLGDVLKDIVPANERNAYLTKDGKINKDGLARAERALFSRAYGDESLDESLLEDFGENLNEKARNMTNALRASAPAIARLQQKIKEGNAHDIGLQKNLVEAVKAIKSAIKQNKPAQSIWEEQTMFDDTAYSPETIEIAKVLHDLRRSGRKLSAFIGKLADLNEQHGNPKDEDLFAGEELAEPSLMNDIPIANQYAEELTRAKYSRDAENQLDNQGEKADNEIVNKYDDLPSEYKTIVDKAVERRTNALLDSVVNSVSKKFFENFTADDAKLGVSVLVEDTGRKSIVLNDLMVNANRYAPHPSNYREVLHNLLPSFPIENKTREELVEAYNTFKKIAEEMLEYGSYTYSELCRRLSDGAGRNAGASTRVDIDRGAAENRAFQRRPEKIKTITELFKKQETKNLKIPKHPHEKQNSRDVSAFSFAGNPLSEQALKAKAEFETPLDKLEKVSRERLHKTERNIQDFGKRIGVPVHFVYHPDRGYRGVCIHNGGIYINLNSNVPARRIFMHEFVHWLKASGKDNNQIFTALASVIETKQGTLNEVRMNEYRRTLYGGEEMSDSQIIEEIVADAMSNSESAEQIMKAIEDYNPDMNVSLWSKIKALWDKFCEAVGFRQNVSAHNQPELYPANQTGKLRQGLNNREMANFNTTLNNLMRKIKDSEGNNVFTMDGTKLTIQGKPFGEAVKINSVDDYRPTVRKLEPAMMFSRDKNADVTDIKNNLNQANENLEKSLGGKITWRDELAYKLTRGAFGKTKKLDNLIVKTHKDLEYDRLVSQGKDPALYKNVGWLQKAFTSPRRIAKRIPLLMPIVKSAVRATERQERLRGKFNDGMNEIMQTLGWNESPLKRNDPKMRERQDKLQRILMAGDLGQVVFTEAQLREYGADQHVIKAYKLMRDLLAKAWKMANDIKEQNKYTTENFDSEGMAAARLADLKAENPFTEIVRTQRADGKVVVTFRTPNTRKVANLHVSKTELDALKNNKNAHIYKEEPSSDYLEGMAPDTYRVSYIEKNPPMGKIEGYIPHIFNGYNLVLADKDGNVKFDKNGLPMIVSSHRSIAEAEKEGSKLAEKNSNVNFVVQPQMNDFMGSAEQAAILGDYSYSNVMSQIANGMNISLADARKLTEGGLAMKSRGRFLGYTMKRKGVTGYEQNVYKATQMYFNQVARYVALDPFKRDAINYYNRTWGAFDDSKVIDRSVNAAFAHRYINDINGVPTGVEKALNSICHDYLHISEERASGRPALWVTQHIFTYPMTIAKLGILNMSSAILNLTQLVNLYGAMGEKTMSPEAYKRLLKQGFVGSMKAMRNKKSPEYKLLFEDMGLRYQIGIDVASGYSNTEVNGIAGLAGKFNRLAGGSMYLFKQSDIFTKGVTMLTAYHKALAEGKSKEEAIEYAKEINTKVNFDYSTADAPELFRALGPLGAILLQFQKYPVKQLELFKDIFDDGRSQGLNRKRSLMRLAKYMTPYMAMSGIMGIPFISLIGGAASIFASLSSGDDFDWDEWIKEQMIEEFGEDSLIAQSILYGGGAMFGFNVGSRVGVGDFGGLSSQESTTAEMLLGKSTLTSTVLSMWRQFGYGNYAEMLKALSPSLGNIAIGLKGEVHTTRGRMKYQYQNAYERALRMIGFNPVNESLAGDLASIEYSKKNDDKHEKEKAVDAFIDEPTNENARKLQELGVTPKTIQNEAARRTMNTHDLNKLKEQEKKEKEAKSKKKEKRYSARDYFKEMK